MRRIFMPVAPEILKKIRANNEKLDLSNCKLNVEDVRDVVAELKALQAEIKLQTLILSADAIAPEDIGAYEAIMDFVIQNKTIIILELAQLVIGDRIALNIANALAENTVIKWVDLTGSRLGVAGMEALNAVRISKKELTIIMYNIRYACITPSSTFASEFMSGFQKHQQQILPTFMQIQQTGRRRPLCSTTHFQTSAEVLNALEGCKDYLVDGGSSIQILFRI